MTLGLIDILKLAGFDPTLKTKLVRHQDRRYPVSELRRNSWLELYQSYQSKPKFHGIEQIVSFYGLPGTRAGFYGVYRVFSHRPASQGPTLAACDWSREWGGAGTGFFYDMTRDQRFDDLRDRLVIDWGPGTLAWVQKLENKPVLEITEPGRRLPPFEDYLEFSLTHAQLKDLFENEEAHRDWRAPLSAVAGIYLVLAQKSGNLYVGSAYRGEWHLGPLADLCEHGRWRKCPAPRVDSGRSRLPGAVPLFGAAHPTENDGAR